MRYTFKQQQDATDCAAECLAMICLHYKKETTITKLRDVMGTDLKSTNLLGLGKCAEKLGFVAQAVRVDREGFLHWLPLKFFVTRKTGDIITRFSDAFTIKNIFAKISLTLIMDIGMALVTGILLLQMNGRLFVVIAFMTILSIFMVFIFKQPYKKINEQQMHKGSVLNSQIIEGLRVIETIKGNAGEGEELGNIEREYIRAFRIGMKEGMMTNIQNSISGLVLAVGNLLLMYLGIMQVIHNEMTLGNLMVFTKFRKPIFL